MNISQKEIDAANYALGELMEAPLDEAVMEHALIAALKVRRVRKQAKREDKFKPCAIHYDEKDATEIMLSDEPAVWYDAKSHVEIAYNFDGLMIGVRLWNVAAKRERQRKEKDKQVVESVKPAQIVKGCGVGNPFDNHLIRNQSTPNSLMSAQLEAVAAIPSKADIERAKNILRSSQLEAVFATHSKAPEWDGTFGVGCYEARNGRKATIAYKEGNYLYGSIMDFDGYRWTLTGSAGEDWHMYDLIRPWPKGEQ